MKFFVLALLLFSLSALFAEESKAATPEDNIIISKENFEKDYVERQILRYERMINDYQKDVQSLIRRSVEEKKRLVEQKYFSVIKQELEDETNNRNDAIVLFENFVKRYSEYPEYAPSAMYRLAELYYERAMLEKETKMEEYEKQIALFEAGKLEKEPEMPKISLEDSIRLYRLIIDKYPKYMYVGGAYYMLGFCLDASGKGDEAIKVWQDILEKKISTDYTAEVYLRMGDYYFSISDQKDASNTKNLALAIESFQKGAEYKNSQLYDKILYKLAWTYYRKNEFQKAIDIFTQLIFFADEMKAKGEDRGQDLRKEAIQYIAISFADEEWGSVDKATAYFNKIDGKLFEVDVFEKLGKYFYENSNEAQAEKAYKFVLERHPFYERAPKIHELLVKMYYKKGNLDKANVEIERFAKMYDDESEWALRNRGNATAIRDASNMAKDFLLGSASYHQQLAGKLKGSGDFDNAKKEYLIAAELYGKYLEKFPYTSESYDTSYNLADSLYFSGQIEKAVMIYERIRDDKNQDKYKNDAGFATYICYKTIWDKSAEQQIKSEEKRGKPFSKLEDKLILSSDAYLELSKEAQDRDAIAYNSARIFFDHGKFEDSEKRYLRIINEYPESEAAIFAAKDIINAYTENKDWVNVAKWSKLLTDRLASKDGKNKEVREEFKAYRGDALFKYAEQLQQENKHREAAEEYLKIVEENPYHQNADKSLFNAAYSFEKALLFDSAMKVHERIYKEYPYSAIAPQSLSLVAYNAEKSYSYEKAIEAYRLLYKKYPTYDKKNAAIYNEAILLEKLKRYKEASETYYLYSKEETKKLDGKEAAYLVGFMYQKAEDWKGMIAKYNQFIDSYKNETEVIPLVMRAFYQISKVSEEKLNDSKRAREYSKKILEYFQSKKIDNDEARLYAAESEFKLIDDDFATYEKLKILGKNQKKLVESLNEKKKMLGELTKRYDEVKKYQTEWSYAAFFRQGNLIQLFSDALYNAPVPPELSEEEAEIYQQTLQDMIQPLEQQAVDTYVKTLEKARENKVFNKWTQLIIERLAKLRPEEYKVGKAPVFAVSTTLETGYPIMLSLDKKEKKQYIKSGIQKSETNEKQPEADKAPEPQKKPEEGKAEKKEGDK